MQICNGCGHIETVVSRWKKFKETHTWFCKHSREYVCTKKGKLFTPLNAISEWRNWPKYTKRQFLYWIVAWCKFMWYSRKDILGA